MLVQQFIKILKMSSYKVIISGGGTGGHIYPAIAIAKKILEIKKDSSFYHIWIYAYCSNVG